MPCPRRLPNYRRPISATAGRLAPERGGDDRGPVDIGQPDILQLAGIELGELAVLGHPAASVAWMIRRMAARGQAMHAGQIVMAGALTEAVWGVPFETVELIPSVETLFAGN